MLYLNRQSLRRLREIRSRIHESEAHVRRGLSALRSISPDQLPREIRARYAEALGRLRRMSDDLGERVEDEVLRDLNRSDFVDKDPDAEKRTAGRRAALAAKVAIYGDKFRPLRPRKNSKQSSP